MRVKAQDYTKPEVLRLFRAWADADSTWQHHVDKLVGIECVGDLPPVDPDFPQKILHPAVGTSLDKAERRHAMRDICRAVAVSESVSNTAMDAAWADRLKCQQLFLSFCNDRLASGDYFVQRQKIEHLRDAETRERRLTVLEIEKRRRSSICDEAARKFSRLQDERFPYDQTCKAFPAAFPGYKPWIQPDTPEPIDERNPTMVAIDEIDWDEIVFSEERAYFIETLAATTVGHVEHGPLIFASKEAAEQFIEDNPNYSLALTLLIAKSVRNTLEWYAHRHRFLDKLPPGGRWLFVVYPALLAAAPPEPEEYETKLEAIKEPSPLEW